ncbi:MAG: hypothetical protein ACREDZ_09900 [Kiloniellales bacterium]
MLSNAAIKTLMRLIDSKIGTFEIYDNEDRRELANLRDCRSQLIGLVGEIAGTAQRPHEGSKATVAA